MRQGRQRVSACPQGRTGSRSRLASASPGAVRHVVHLLALEVPIIAVLEGLIVGALLLLLLPATLGQRHLLLSLGGSAAWEGRKGRKRRGRQWVFCAVLTSWGASLAGETAPPRPAQELSSPKLLVQTPHPNPRSLTLTDHSPSPRPPQVRHLITRDSPYSPDRTGITETGQPRVAVSHRNPRKDHS